MKKISDNSKYSRIETKVRLFKEDLEYLTNQMSDNFDYVKIYIDEYELDKFSEVNDIKKEKTNYFKISAYDKGNGFDNLKMTISIDEDVIVLHFYYYNELKCKAIEGIIIDLINKRKLFINYIGSGYVYWTSIIILGILAVLIRDQSIIKILNIYYIIILAIIFLVLMILSYCIRFKIRNIIILRKQRYSFYRRNKDKIIIGIIVAIISSLITALISYFISLKIR